MIELEDMFKVQVADFNGPDHRVIRQVPYMYRCLSSLLMTPVLAPAHRHRLFAVLGYLILPEDLYPESELGPEGFVDDMMLSLTVIRSVAEDMGVEAVLDAWEGDEAEMRWMLDEGLSGLIESRTELYQRVMSFMGF